MAGTPFRERRVSPEETRRIVARAIALGGRGADANTDAPALTEAELAQRLSELGLSEDVIERAMMSSVEEAPAPAAGAIQVVHEKRFEGMIPAAQHEALAEAMSSAMGTRGRVEVVGQKLTRTPGGVLQEPILTVRSRDGHTDLRVEETLANRGQRAIASATMAALSALFAFSPALALARMLTGGSDSPLAAAVVVAFLAMAMGASLWLVRKMFARRLETRTAFLGDALTKVTSDARALAAPTTSAEGAGAATATAAAATAATAAAATDHEAEAHVGAVAAEAEAEAQAEAEAAEAEAARVNAR